MGAPSPCGLDPSSQSPLLTKGLRSTGLVRVTWPQEEFGEQHETEQMTRSLCSSASGDDAASILAAFTLCFKISWIIKKLLTEQILHLFMKYMELKGMFYVILYSLM